MELRQLKTFFTVSQLLSFNRAAETLNYAQSTISAQIKALEEEFDKPLFDRLGKRIVLTEAGKTLLKYAKKILDMEEETMAEVSGVEENHGSLTVRIPQSLGTYFLPGVLKEFNKEYPGVKIDVKSCSITIQQELRSGIVDVAFLLSDSITASNLKAEVMDISRLVLISGANHPLAKKKKIRIDDLNGEVVLLPKQD